MTFSPFLCLNEEIMQCFFVNGAKIVFNSFRYNKSLKPKKERNGAYSARTAHPFQRNGAPFRFKLSKAQQVD